MFNPYDFPKRIWPERWYRFVQKDKKPVHVIRNGRKIGISTFADIVWPSMEEVVKLMGGSLPSNPYRLLRTKYGKRIAKLIYDSLAGVKHHSVPEEDIIMIYIRCAWHVVHWMNSDARLYQLDKDTAFALMHTRIEDVPISAFQLPMRSFFLRMPPEMEWTVELTPEGDNDAEPVQDLEGFMVTGEYDEEDKLERLHVIVCGKAVKSKIDNIHWLSYPVGQAITMGDILHCEMINEDSQPDDYLCSHYAHNLPAIRVLMGAILYITSAHPQLEAMRRPEKPKGRATNPKHQRKHRRFATLSESSASYVGGPLQGIVREKRMLPFEDVGSRKPPKPHVRAGHWRRAWCGTGEGRHTELRWIQPVEVGSWDRVLAWESAKGYSISKRVIRTAQKVVAV